MNASYFKDVYGQLANFDLNNHIIANVSESNLLKFTEKLKLDRKLHMMLMSIHCVDYPDKVKRFEVIYNFLSLHTNIRLLVKVQCEDGVILQSISNIFPNSVWYEREVWDMYGVIFQGNIDMRRILTDYGFVGHPMRKDFPLTGYVELDYNNEKSMVQYSNVNLQQDFRSITSQSGWNRVAYSLLHGDEKASTEEQT